jgi:diaminopimelate decarboxylase
MSRAQALAAWRGRARWPHLEVDGLHLHIGSQILDPAPLLDAARAALALVAESGAAGAPVRRVNLGGGFGVDYEAGERVFDARGFARAVAALPGAGEVAWAFEPGRVLTAAFGTLVAEVLWDKRRDDPDGEHRFVVLAAGMNDLIRPALYGASHRIVPLRPRAGALVRAAVVGPVCETSDEFATDLRLPPLETGDPVAILDAGAYGSAMSSNYNGRSSLAEVVRVRGEWRLARPPGATRMAMAPPAERLPEL